MHACVLVLCAASQLSKVVLMDLGFAGTRDKEKRLETLLDRLNGFAKRNKLQLHLSAFTKTLLHYPTEQEFPCGFLSYELCGMFDCWWFS